jgi:hypothetical protein
MAERDGSLRISLRGLFDEASVDMPLLAADGATHRE